MELPRLDSVGWDWDACHIVLQDKAIISPKAKASGAIIEFCGHNVAILRLELRHVQKSSYNHVLAPENKMKMIQGGQDNIMKTTKNQNGYSWSS
jgi:hypothetical protein